MTVTTPKGDTYRIEIKVERREDYEYRGFFTQRLAYFVRTSITGTILDAVGNLVTCVVVLGDDRAEFAELVKHAIRNDQNRKHPIEKTVIKVTV